MQSLLKEAGTTGEIIEVRQSSGAPGDDYLEICMEELFNYLRGNHRLGFR